MAASGVPWNLVLGVGFAPIVQMSVGVYMKELEVWSVAIVCGSMIG
jgi:hypothetical protein